MKVNRVVRHWLLIGVILILVQILLGGITRLTDSGLSITEWNVIQGTFPPMSIDEWDKSFSMYKIAASKQFNSLHFDMTLSEFKWIFFWEYFHRLWARSMGFIFLFPFIYFLNKKFLPTWLIKRLGVVILLASLAAVFGIVMVYSGLNDDNRTWVSAYRLTGHLVIAISLLGYLFFTWRKTISLNRIRSIREKRLYLVLGTLVFLQIILGGLMAGMRAGLVHPFFSLFYNFDSVVDILRSDGFDLINYESSGKIKILVQIFHRTVAFGILIFTLYLILFRKIKFNVTYFRSVYMFISLLIIQIVLGLITVSLSGSGIPVFWGSLHQVVGILTFLSLLWIFSYFE